MSWVMVDDGVPNHPKFLRAGPAASWLWICGVAYCRRHHTNGVIPKEAMTTLGVPNPRPLLDRLVKVGLFEPHREGWQVHDYEVQYGDDEVAKTDKDERHRRRQEAGRRGGLAKSAAFPSIGEYWLYLAHHVDGEWVKVGVTSDPDRRELALRTERSSLLVDCLWSLGRLARVDALRREREAHDLLGAKAERRPGELFRLTTDQAQAELVSVFGAPVSPRLGSTPLLNASIATASNASDGDSRSATREGGDRSGIGEEGSGEKPPTVHPFDQWLRQLQGEYPADRITIGHLTEHAFLQVFERDPRNPDLVFSDLRSALANHKASQQWSSGKVPRLDRWLQEGMYAQRHTPAGGSPQASSDPAHDAAKQRYGRMEFGR